MQNRNTEQEFITAFWNLYNVKTIEKISVNQLCQSAGYNRSTFYNHFVDIYDLRDKSVDTIFQPIKAKLLTNKDFRIFLQGNTAKSILSFYFSKQDKYIEILFKRHAGYLLGEKIKKNFFAHIRNQLKVENIDLDEIEIVLEYQISAALGVINYWYQHEKAASVQDMLNKIFIISSKGALHTLESELDKIYGKECAYENYRPENQEF